MPIFRRSKKEKKEPVEELLNAVQKFVSAPTMEESRRILEDNQDLLFSDAAEFVINKLIADFEGDDQVTMVLERHRDLLALCKYEGIDSAFRSQTPTRRPASPKNYYQLYSEGLRNIQQGNIEAAIKLLDQALDEMGFLAGDSELWASAHHNLGEAYRMRSKGSKAANLEKCLEHYQMALNERSFKECPEAWARTNNSLGAAYAQRMKGNFRENIEQAIFYFEEALRVYNPKDYPAQWANLQNNLGHIYLDRIAGKHPDNFLEALRYFSEFAKVYDPKKYPDLWAPIDAHLKATKV